MRKPKRGTKLFQRGVLVFRQSQKVFRQRKRKVEVCELTCASSITENINPCHIKGNIHFSIVAFAICLWNHIFWGLHDCIPHIKHNSIKTIRPYIYSNVVHMNRWLICPVLNAYLAFNELTSFVYSVIMG